MFDDDWSLVFFVSKNEVELPNLIPVEPIDGGDGVCEEIPIEVLKKKKKMMKQFKKKQA